MPEKIGLPKFLKDVKSNRTEPLRMPPAVREAVEKSERGAKLSAKEKKTLGDWLLLFPDFDINNASVARVMGALRAAEASGILPQSGRADSKGRR